MVGSSKILTVSYGTFSCTLEGFDDSFDTMKAIAEYFRDLAADDRYFGAEPPTPDAEMLARIAERETTRRVEALMESSGIVLRAAIGEETVASPVAEPVRAEATPEPKPAPETSAAEMYVPPMPAPRDEPPAPVDTESVAAKLQRIRAVVGRSTAATPSESYVEDLPLAEVVADPVAEQAFDDTDFDTPMAEPVEAFDEEAFEEPIDVFEAPEGAEIAADEQGIAAVIAEEEVLDQEEAIAAVAEDILTELPEQILEEDVSEDDIAELEALIAAADDAEDAAEEDFAIDDTSEDDEAAVAEAKDLDDDEDGWDEVVDDLTADGTIEEPISNKVFQLTESIEADDEAEAVYAEDDVEDDDDDTDLIAAIAAENDEDTLDLAKLGGLEELEAFAEFDEGELSDEDEAALMRDLAWADEDEIEDKDTDLALNDEDVEEEEIAAVENAREMLGAEPDEDEAAMARIMSQTDAEMEEPESKVRRDAIAHLKAAYAATEAARALGEKPGDDTEVRSAFRQDLDTVIRPVRRVPRFEAGEPRAERPVRPRVTPLRLVASQRVDIEPVQATPGTISPVRPRRAELVERPQASAPRGASSFADYAEEVGATSLAELLEAAAAYTSYVEGVDEFSRPQIMKKVRDLSPDDFNREDGLRSFGTLLRQGRIMKIRNGRFQISDQTRFRPEPRTAQG